MKSKRQTKKTLTISMFAAGLLAAANAITMTSAANALANHTDGLRPSPVATKVAETSKWQVAEAGDETKKKKKKKKRRHGSFFGG